MDYILSELSTMSHLSWVALHGMAHCFIELDKAVVHVISLVSFLSLFFSLCLPSPKSGKLSHSSVTFTLLIYTSRIDAFELWCWGRLLRVAGTERRSNQSILKEIDPEYSLGGLMLKLQYFGHLMQRTNSLEKTLMLQKIEGRRRE